MVDISTYPFYDDFATSAQAKEYHKILFVPGNAVQARELTQIQSMLQNQVKILGDSIFQNGTVVIPGNVFYDNTVTYLKMVSVVGSTTIASVGQSLVGQSLVGQTTGVSAQVILYAPATATDPDTLFIKYTSANGAINSFNTGEILSSSTLGVVVQIASNTNSIGTGSICSISQGIFYVNGYFVGVAPQTIALDKYDSLPTFAIGLQFVENIITPAMDSTLYDNALGFSNYAAPGADRYQIQLVLTANNFDGSPQTGASNVTFITLLKIKNGAIQYQNNQTQYSAIEKLVAQRTYDTSGDFVVKQFGYSAIDYRNNNRGQWVANTPYIAGDVVSNLGIFYVAQTTGYAGASAPIQTFGEASDGTILWLQSNIPQYDTGTVPITSSNLTDHINAESYFQILATPGKAYINGFDVELNGNTYIQSPKARTTNQLTANAIYTPVGSYVQVTNVAGYINTGTMTPVNIYDALGVVRGTAFATMMEYVSGSVGPSTTMATCTISTSTLTVSGSVTGSAIYVGMPVYGQGVTPGTFITSFIGGSGGTGTYGISIPQTITVGEPMYSSTGLYNLYLIKIRMNVGYDFTDDILSINSSTGSTFYGQMLQFPLPISGYVSTVAGSNKLIGAGTLFVSSLKVGDQIVVNGQSNTVQSISSNLLAYVYNAWTASATNVSASTLNINFVSSGNYLQSLPHSYIKSLRTSSGVIDTTYTVFKTIQINSISTTTLQSSLTTPGESFAGLSGHYLVNSATNVVSNPTYSFGANNNTQQLIMTGAFSSGVTYYLIARVTRSGAAALQKTKTLTTQTIVLAAPGSATGHGVYSGTLNTSTQLSTSSNYTSTIISLLQADAQTICKVTMSGPPAATTNYPNWLNTDYNSVGEVDITSWYKLNPNTGLEYYDISYVTRKTGVNPPSLPIKITFTYFAHSSGDYFSVDSYSGTNYETIPTEIHNGVTYPLRDCLDFRSKVALNGADFSSSGAVVSTPLDPLTPMFSSYSYYLGRTDLLALNQSGSFEYFIGTPADFPVAPPYSHSSLLMATIQINPFTGIPPADAQIYITPHLTYQMKDIAKLDGRLTTIENTIALNQLESQTANLTIYDSNGLTRFKNGFIADNFTTLNVSDISSSDFKAAVNIINGTLSPQVDLNAIALVEPSGTTPASRAASGYQITGDYITLPYTEVPLVSQTTATNTSNINPFTVFSWTGMLQLSPNVDSWTDVKTLNNYTAAPSTSTTNYVNTANVALILQPPPPPPSPTFIQTVVGVTKGVVAGYLTSGVSTAQAVVAKIASNCNCCVSACNCMC